jgi:hypothetical protein
MQRSRLQLVDHNLASTAREGPGDEEVGDWISLFGGHGGGGAGVLACER